MDFHFSECQWFKKKWKILLNDHDYMKCSSSKNGIDRLIFPFGKSGEHITLSLANDYLDCHVKKNGEYIPIYEIRKHTIIAMVKSGRFPVRRIRFNSKKSRKLMSVDPRSNEFLKHVDKICSENILLNDLRKIFAEAYTSGKDTFAINNIGKLKGVMRCNQQKKCFELASNSHIKSIMKKIFSKEVVEKRLKDAIYDRPSETDT